MRRLSAERQRAGAEERRRLIAAGVNPRAAGVLAAGIAARRLLAPGETEAAWFRLRRRGWDPSPAAWAAHRAARAEAEWVRRRRT